ncbi:MAG: hypothetical protein ACRC11_15495 [Xenococcaceae cyanobacterium]
MTNTQEKKSLLDADSAMNSKATSVQKSSTIIIKNHPEHQGQMYQVKEVDREGKVTTVENHWFHPDFFDVVSDWQSYNGGFARFNQTTGELIDEKDIKKYLAERLELRDGHDGWVDRMVIESDCNLMPHQVKTWLTENEGTLVERHEDGEHWRLIAGNSGNRKSPNVVTKEKSQIVSSGGNLQTMTLEDAETLRDFEQIIRDNLIGFYLVGKALTEIRDRQLYIDEFNTFEQYCKSPLTLLRLGIGSKGRAYDFINAASVITILEKSPMATQLPTNERQIRPMVKGKLNAEQIIDVWGQAVEEAEDKPPTGAIVEDIVRVLKEEERDKLNLENPYSVGDVLRFNSNGDPDTRSRNKRWAIVVQKGEFSCVVSDFEGEFSAHINQLERFEIDDFEKTRAPILRDRLAAIDTSEPLVKKNVEYFAKLDRISLSEKEEAILKVLED